MQKIGYCIAIAALTAAAFDPTPSAAFGFNIGPFHLGLPLPFPRLGYHALHRPARGETSHVNASRDEADLSPAVGGAAQAPSSALLYPAITAPAVFEDVFWPTSSPWPFGYDAVLQTAFAKAHPEQEAPACPQPSAINTIVGRIQRDIRPAGQQLQELQRLGGALAMSASYLAKTCPNDIPAQPVARLQLMEWQIEKVAEALDIVRQPLQDFERSLSPDQRERFSRMTAGTRAERPETSGAPACAPAPTAADESIEQISAAVAPDDTQRAAVSDLKHSLNGAAAQLDGFCPTAAAASPLTRLEAAEAQLDTTWRAAVSIQVALADFERGLNDQQRARLDATELAATQ